MVESKLGPSEHEPIERHCPLHTCRRVYAVMLIVIFFLQSCTTAWHQQGAFYRTAQTQLQIQSEQPGKVYVNNKYVGVTPLDIPLTYSQEVERKTRHVSYWESQPGWSLFLTLASLGLYLPFSVIPVDVETAMEPREAYKDNIFYIEVDTEGKKNWRQEIVAKGEQTLVLHPLPAKDGP